MGVSIGCDWIAEATMEWIVWLSCYSEPTIASPDLRPHLGIDRQCTHTPGFGVEEGSMMTQLSIAEEPRQHGESTRGKSLVDEGLLPRELRLQSNSAEGPRQLQR
jgi:hypothetical protein